MHVLVYMTGAAKVDHLQIGAFGRDKKDVLRLEIAVHHAHVGTGEKDQGSAELARKLEGEVEGDAAKVRVGEQLIEVVGEALKHQAPVALVRKVALQVHYSTENKMHIITLVVDGKKLSYR